MQGVEDIKKQWAGAKRRWALLAIRGFGWSALSLVVGGFGMITAAALYQGQDVPSRLWRAAEYFVEIWPVLAVFVLGWPALIIGPRYLKARKLYREALKDAEQRRAYLEVKDVVHDGSLTEEPNEPVLPPGGFEAAKEAGVAAFREFVAANPMAIAVVCAEHAFMRRHLTKEQDEQVMLAARKHAFRHLTGRLGSKTTASFSRWFTSVEAAIRKDVDLRCVQIDRTLHERAQHERARHERGWEVVVGTIYAARDLCSVSRLLRRTPCGSRGLEWTRRTRPAGLPLVHPATM